MTMRFPGQGFELPEPLYAPPMDKGGTTIQSGFLDRKEIQGEHIYVIVDQWEADPSTRNQAQMEELLKKMGMWGKSDPRALNDPGTLDAMTQLSTRVTKMLDEMRVARGNIPIPEGEKGTKNLGTFFTSVLPVKDRFPDNWETHSAAEKTEKIWNFIEEYIILAQTTGPSPWMPVEIIHKEVEGLPDKASVELLIASLRFQGGEHIGLADRLETDIYRIQKIFRVGHALQNIQKDSEALANFYRDTNNLFSTPEMNDLAKLGEGYMAEGNTLSEQFLYAFQMMHAVCRPSWEQVYVEGLDGVYRYPIASDYSFWPQTKGGNKETRMEIRRAMGSLLEGDNTLRGIINNPNSENKMRDLKEHLGLKIEAMKKRSENKPGEIAYDDDYYEADPTRRINHNRAKEQASHGALAEMLATNWYELNLLSAKADAGAKIPSNLPQMNGLPVLKNVDGFTATFVPTKNMYTTFYRRKLRKGGGEGTPGPECTDGDFPATGHTILEYFTTKPKPIENTLDLVGQTLLDAIMNARNKAEYQAIFSETDFKNMLETTQGTMEMLFKFYDKYIITLGIPWKSIKQPVPGSNGTAIEFNPEVGKKVQKMARDVYYLLTRSLYEPLEMIIKEFATKDAYANYLELERAYRATLNKAAFVVSHGGVDGEFAKHYKKLNTLPAKSYKLYDGFKEDVEDERRMRFAARFFDGIDDVEGVLHVPRLPSGKIDKEKLDFFEKEVFYPSNGIPIDYFAAMEKLYMGKLIIGDILGQGQAEDIKYEDARAIMALLVKDCWQHEIGSMTAKIRARLSGVERQLHSYEGYGKFTYEEANAILVLAGIPTNIVARARSFYTSVVSKEHV